MFSQGGGTEIEKVQFRVFEINILAKFIMKNHQNHFNNTSSLKHIPTVVIYIRPIADPQKPWKLDVQKCEKRRKI